MKYLAVTKTGHYSRRRVRSTKGDGIKYQSWDTTVFINEAHRFPTRRAAEKHAKDWPVGWKIVEVEN